MLADLTFGEMAVGLGIVLMLVQFYIILKSSSINGARRGMVFLMLSMALLPPLLAYLAFYLVWPELGAMELGQ